MKVSIDKVYLVGALLREFKKGIAIPCKVAVLAFNWIAIRHSQLRHPVECFALNHQFCRLGF